MDCNNCKEKRAEPVPFVVFESTKATMERTIRRLWILVLVLVIMLVGTNAAWIYYESQWEVVETTSITQENDNGYNNYIGNDGDIYNGKANGYED